MNTISYRSCSKSDGWGISEILKHTLWFCWGGGEIPCSSLRRVICYSETSCALMNFLSTFQALVVSSRCNACLTIHTTTSCSKTTNEYFFFSSLSSSIAAQIENCRALSYRPKRVPEPRPHHGIHDGRTARGSSGHDAGEAARGIRIRLPTPGSGIFAILWSSVVQVIKPVLRYLSIS